MKRGIAVMLLGSLAVVGGCASPARYVEKKPDSGIVAIPENTNYWPTYYKRDAIALIQQHVGPNYEIIDQRQVVTGQTTQNTQQTSTDHQTTTGLTTTQNSTEWQITYRKLAGAPYSPGGAPMNTLAPGTVQAQPSWVPSVQPVSGVQGTSSGVQPAGGTPTRFGN